MGAHKNSSRRMNSAYDPNSQSWIPTRVCQGHIVTTDLPTLGTNSKSKQHGSTSQKATNIGDLQWPGRTIRTEGAESPRGLGGPSASKGRTIRKWHPNLQYRTAKNGPSVLYLRTVRTHLADYLPNFVQPKSHDQTDRTKGEQEHTKNLTNCWLKASSRTVRQGCTDVRVVHRQQLEPDLLKVNSSSPLPDLPNQPRDCYQIIGEGEAPLGDAIPTSL
jgi:hypothetical protein